MQACFWPLIPHHSGCDRERIRFRCQLQTSSRGASRASLATLPGATCEDAACAYPSRCAPSSRPGKNEAHDPLDINMTNKPKPVHEVRLGHIKAAVWRNETEAGVRHNVTFSRLYRDDNQWRSTDSFGRDDLLVIAKVADLVHSWIFAQSLEEEAATKSAASSS